MSRHPKSAASVSSGSFRTAFFQAPAPSSVPSRVPPLSALLRAIPLERSSFEQSPSEQPSFERPPSSVPPSIVRAYNTRFFAKYARIFRKARLRIREQFSLRSMIKALQTAYTPLMAFSFRITSRSLFMRHSACCFPSGYCRLSPLAALFQ